MFFSLQNLRQVQKMEQKPLEAIFAEILDIYEQYDGSETELLKKAFEFGKNVHSHQIRESGAFYFSHPLIAAWLMLPLKPDAKLIIATMLHDTVEDSQKPEQTEIDVKEIFGSEIAHIIDGVSKVGNVEMSVENGYRETLKKIFAYSSSDVRILVVKLFDRLHNILTLGTKKDPKKRAAKAKETLEIFIPAAQKLGIWELKKNLEDACAMHLSPEIFDKIADRLEMQSRIARELFSDVEKNLRDMDFEKNFSIKYIPYSFSTLLQRDHLGKNVLPEFLFFVEITVPTESDCYTFLAETTKKYPQKEEFLQDYILNPKENWYRGIHTTLVVNNAHLVRFHVLSESMAQRNEKGVFVDIANKNFALPLFESELFSEANISSDAFVELLQHDVLLPKICVHHAEKGKKYVPKNSTALDAAIRFYPEEFPYLETVFVNNEKNTLQTPLKQNDIVSFSFDLKKNISLDWITFVHSSFGKFQIQHILKQESEEKKVEMGRKTLQNFFDAVRMENVESLLERYPEILSHFHAENKEDIFRFVAEGLIAPEEIINFVAQKTEKKLHWWRKIFPSFFPIHRENTLSLSAFSKHLSLSEFAMLFSDLCEQNHLKEQKMVFSHAHHGVKVNAKLVTENKKNIFLFFSALQKSSAVSEFKIHPSWKFHAYIFSLVAFPFLVAWGIVSFLLSPFGENHFSFSFFSILLFTLANTWSFRLLSRYFFILKNNIVILLFLFGINALAITAWIFLSFPLFFTQSSYSTLSMLLSFIFLLAFLVPLLTIANKKEMKLKNDEKQIDQQEWKKKKKEKLAGYIMRIGAVICFGLSPIFTKYFFEAEIHRVFVMSLSFFFAGLTLLPFFIWNIVKKEIHPKESFNGLFWVVIISALFFFVCFNASLQFTTASNPPLILNLAPIIGLLVGVFFLSEKASYLQNKKDAFIMFFLFFLGLLGTFFLMMNKGNMTEKNFSQKILGDFLGIAAMIFDVIYTIALIHYSKAKNSLSGMKFTMMQTLILSFLFLPFAVYYFLHFPPLTGKEMFGIFMIGIVGSILGYYLAYESFKRLDGFINYLLMNLFPLITVTLEVFFFNLPISVYLILGGVLILGSSLGAEILNTHCEKRHLQK